MTSQYLTLAFQYYIAARSSTFAWSLPVAGNLFHHSVEMFLKYILIDKSYSAEVLRNKFGHNLNKLWSEAKSVLHNSGLNKFDALVDGLNEFEELRYPGKGYKITISVHKHTQLDGGYGSNRTKHYQTCLEDIDEFVTTILKDIVNPEFVKSMLMGDALAQYHRDNKYPFF